MDYRELAKEVHQTAVEKGFWEDTNEDEKLMLIISEFSEVLDADRKGRRCLYNPETFQKVLESYCERSHQYDTRIPIEQGFKHVFEQSVKDTLEAELADTFIRCLDYLQKYESEYFEIRKVECEWSDNLGKNLYTILKDSIFNSNVERCAGYILSFAEHMDINLEWFVEQTMKYNSKREKFHGKKY